MATDYLEPNGDGATTDCATFGSGSAHYDRVAKGVQQPTTPSTSNGVESGSGQFNKVDIFAMATRSVSSVSQVKVWVYGECNSGDAGNIDVDLYMGSWQGNAGISGGGAMNPAAWGSATFNGSWNQSDLDGMEVKLTVSGGDSSNAPIYAVYAEITYTGGGGGGSVGSQAMVINAGAGNV